MCIRDRASDSVNSPRMAELLNGMWAQIGVKTELQALDADTLTAACCPAFDFNIILWGWGSDPVSYTHLTARA